MADVDITPRNAIKIGIMVILIAWGIRTLNRATGLNLPSP